jgi:hypothetical protein
VVLSDKQKERMKQWWKDNPVIEEGKWFWFDDTTGRRHGPFETEKDAELDMEQTLRG